MFVGGNIAKLCLVIAFSSTVGLADDSTPNSWTTCSSFEDNVTSCQVIEFKVNMTCLANLTVNMSSLRRLQGVSGGTLVSCSGESGILLLDVHNLCILDMDFKGCGFSFKTKLGISFRAAVLISGSNSVSITNCKFLQSDGTGLVLVNNSEVNITYSTFDCNTLNGTKFDNMTVNSGGGIYLSLSCYRQDNGCMNFIDNCSFTGNLQVSGKEGKAEELLCVESGFFSFDYTGGGGLSVRFPNLSHNVSLFVSYSDFTNNSGSWGGGAKIIFCNDTKGNNLEFLGCTFEGNKAPEYGGGAVDAGFLGTSVTHNHLKFSQIQFESNHAFAGGGVYLFSIVDAERQENLVVFLNSTWQGNRAHYGSAIDLLPPFFHMVSLKPKVVITDCHFQENTIDNMQMHKDDLVKRIGEGIIMATEYVIEFNGEITFSKNNGTCLYATSSVIFFKNESKALFLGNVAQYGAGISLIGFSIIIVSEYTDVTFCNNTGLRRGGAIYVFSIDKNDYAFSQHCFIQKLSSSQSRKNVNFNFFGNKAVSNVTYQGFHRNFKDDSIYGRSLAFCKRRGTEEYEFSKIGNFRYCNICVNETAKEHKCPKSHATDPLISSHEKEFYVNSDQGSLTFIPGKMFELPLIIADSTSNSSSKLQILLLVSLNNSRNSNIILPPEYTYINMYSLKLYGKPNDMAKLILTEWGLRKYSITFNITAEYCPPLFRINGTFACICISPVELNFVEFHKCNYYRASLRLGYWIGYEDNYSGEEKKNSSSDHYTLLSSYCPRGYCASLDNTVYYRELPETFTDDLSETVCNKRNGTLCGVCSNSTTVYFHSETFQCGSMDRCHLGPLFYILSEILPLTLLFLFVIFFDINFTSGSLNGFIFFAQMYDTISQIGASFITYSDHYSKFSLFHRLVYKIFNIDFFDIDELSFCLFQTPNTLSILMMKYVTVMYGFILIVGTVWLVRFCSKFRCLKIRPSRLSLLQGLSAFLVMIYSQCIYVSFAIINPINIYNGRQYHSTVVFFQGNWKYFKLKHLPYALTAVFCIVTLAFVPLFLILYPLSNKILAYFKIEETRVVKFISQMIPTAKFKPIFDCFQGTFKDDFRYFAGLYFVYRIAIHAARFHSNVIVIHTIIEATIIGMLVLHNMAWPYQNKLHNIIDLLIFANLAVINSLKLLNFFFSEKGIQTKKLIRVIHWIQLFFICLPLVGLSLGMGHVLFRKLKRFKSVRKLQRQFSRDTHYINEAANSSDDSDINADDANNEELLFMDRGDIATDSYRLVKDSRLEMCSF